MLLTCLHFNIHSLHPWHEKPSCVIYTYLFGCLGSNLSLLSSPSSTHHLSSCLSVCLSFCLSLLVPLNRAKLVLSAQSKLVSANCNELIPFQFSAKTNFTPLLNEFPFPFSWERRTPNLPQSNKNYFKLRIYTHIYQSRQSRRVLLCQTTSVWVLPRITNFTHHSHHSRLYILILL